ncbi:hypothetical protein BZM26_30740 [Paraburkholderia strydomiana]|nr:hypothetical protein BZM26_30740 [Paraburkholderia strydomiana]
MTTMSMMQKDIACPRNFAGSMPDNQHERAHSDDLCRSGGKLNRGGRTGTCPDDIEPDSGPDCNEGAGNEKQQCLARIT